MPAIASFTASGTAATANVTATGTQVALPTPDPSNLDLAITSTGTVWLSFAPNVPVGDNVPGCIMIAAGTQVLLTPNNAVALLLSANPLVLNGPQATAAGTATVASAKAAQGAIVTFQRGTATATPIWRA